MGVLMSYVGKILNGFCEDSNEGVEVNITSECCENNVNNNYYSDNEEDIETSDKIKRI